MPALVFRLLAGMVVLTGLGSSAAAAERSAEAAPTKTVHLTLISEGAACPQIGAQIQREIAAFSTQIVFPAHAETAAQAQRIQVRTQAQATTGYLADLLTEGETRRIDGTTCDALADAITLILLVAYDPETPIPSTQARAPFAKPAAAPTTASTAPVAPVA